MTHLKVSCWSHFCE